MRLIKGLILAALLALAAPAHALTIYAVGAEDLDFGTIGTVALDQTSGHFDSNLSRGDEKVNATCSSSLLTNAIIPPVMSSAESVFWAHGKYYVPSTAPAGAGCDLVYFLDTGNVIRLILRSAASGNGSVDLVKVNSSGTRTVLATGINALTYQVLSTFDFQINYSVTGTFNFYINNTLIVGYSGDVTTDGQTQLSYAKIGNIVGNQANGFSEIIFADSDTRSMRLFTNYPEGDGNTQAWICTSGTYASVNAWNTVAAGDPQNCNSGSATQIEEFSGLSCPSGNWAVAGVVTSIRAAAANGGPQGIEHDVRTGGTSYQSSNFVQGASYQNSQNVWATNPNTSAPWTCPQIGTMNFGAESHS